MDVDIVVSLLLEEEAEEEALLLSCLLSNERTHPLFLKREEEGCFKVLILRHLLDYETKFREYFRVTPQLFHDILEYIKEDITTPECNRVKNPISPMQKLCLTLRYMATGESFRSLAFQFRICQSWISIIVKKTLQAICSRMLDTAIPSPNTELLKKTAEGFYNRWDYPNCCGAVDGKHVRIVCPDNSGTLFHNYKEFFSIVLFAVVDHNYKFLAIDVGSYGKEGDATIFSKSAFGKALQNGSIELPAPTQLPKTNIQMPHVLVGDEAFRLTPTMMRPYPKEQSNSDEGKAIYNYRHCRARRVSENAFGMLCQYFRVFFTPIALKPETTDYLVVSACIVYNMLRSANIPCPNEEKDEIRRSLPRENLLPIQPAGGNASKLAFSLRDKFKKYFCSHEGKIEWQLEQVRKTA